MWFGDRGGVSLASEEDPHHVGVYSTSGVIFCMESKMYVSWTLNHLMARVVICKYADSWYLMATSIGQVGYR